MPNIDSCSIDEHLFSVDHRLLAPFPILYVLEVAECVRDFAARGCDSRTYDAQAVLGHLWLDEDIEQLIQILNVLTSFFDSPLFEVPQPLGANVRYKVGFRSDDKTFTRWATDSSEARSGAL
jgi:hypothetical protein